MLSGKHCTGLRAGSQETGREVVALSQWWGDRELLFRFRDRETGSGADATEVEGQGERRRARFRVWEPE